MSVQEVSVCRAALKSQMAFLATVTAVKPQATEILSASCTLRPLIPASALGREFITLPILQVRKPGLRQVEYLIQWSVVL